MLEPNPTKWPFYRCHFAIFSIVLLAFVLPVSQQWEIDDAIARIAAAEWPRFRKSWDDDAERSFIRQQQANSPSWSISYASPTADDEGRQVRPYHRHFFAVPRFARPPDPQTLWKDQMMAGNGKEALEPFGGGGGSQPQIPQAIRNYFALDAPPEKVVKELTGIDMRSLLGPALDQLVETTAAPTWTRATTPKDKLVQYFERSLDDFLSGRLPAMERIPYLAEKEKLLSEGNVAEIEEAAGNSTKNETNKQADEPAEGSGEAPEEQEQQQDQPQQQQQPSSIAGIPKQMPFIPKVPPRFGRQQDSEIVSKSVEEMRPPPLLENPFRLTITNAGEESSAKEIRRHPGMAKAKAKEEEKMTRMKLAEEELLLAKTMEEDFQYGQKPSRQQGVLGSLLDFFGINSPRSGTELDQVITDWLMEHSPKHRSKMEKRTNQQSSYNQLKQLLSQPLMPLCSPQPEVVANFQVDAFMGQWFEVMSPSPLVASPSCTIISYRMLSRNGAASGVGSVFQTMQLSLPKQPKKSPTTAATAFDGAFEQHFVPSSPSRLTSGYAIVSRPGQMLFRKSDSPEEVQVQVIDAGYSADRKRYEWAILGINCNFPLHVIVRDPLLFKQKYERLVVQMLERRGLVSELSRLLNLVAGVDPDSCRVPANFFA